MCNVIIDEGRCQNVIGTLTAEKLDLPKEEHPYPYKVTSHNGSEKVMKCQDTVLDSLEGFMKMKFGMI